MICLPCYPTHASAGDNLGTVQQCSQGSHHRPAISIQHGVFLNTDRLSYLRTETVVYTIRKNLWHAASFQVIRIDRGKVSQLPALICTLGYDPTSATLKIAPVKNRFGPHTADASRYATLYVNYSACQITENAEYGHMYVRDARAGYTGGYNPE